MFTVKTIPEFDAWLNGLKDRTTRLRLSRRLDRRNAAILVTSNMLAMIFMTGHWRFYFLPRIHTNFTKKTRENSFNSSNSWQEMG